MDEMKKYFTGRELYGDNFSLAEIQDWFRQEEEGYSEVVKGTKAESTYESHYMNEFFGFRYLPKSQKFEHAIGIGSAMGDEFLPLSDRIKNLCILEPSEVLRSQRIGSLTPTYVKPQVSGTMGFSDNTFDLMTCFGTLHHIPNVRHVLSEMIRVLKPGGYLLLREPIRTMGDWRYPRRGLTRNERGIPHTYFDKFFTGQPVRVVKRSFCESLFAYRVIRKIFGIQFESRAYPPIDNFFSKLFQWNVHYHPGSVFEKIAPGSIFYVIQKNHE